MTVHITARGVTLSMRGWARQVSISRSAIQRRLSDGWDTDRALFTPATRGGDRWSPTRRIRCGREQRAAKLTDSQVSRIRAIHIRYDWELGATALARRYGVSKTVIQGIIAGVRWKHVPPASRRPWE